MTDNNCRYLGEYPFIRTYQAPDQAPTTKQFRGFSFPDHPAIRAAISNQLAYLALECTWEDSENVSGVDMQAVMSQMLLEWFGVENSMLGVIYPVVTSQIPNYMLWCDGSQHNRADYPHLYAMLDPVYIVDADHFITPDLRGRFILGEGGGFVRGASGGETQHTLTVDEMPPHNHTSDYPFYGIDVESVGVPDPTGLGNPPMPSLTSTVGGGAPHNNMPPYHVLKYAMIAK